MFLLGGSPRRERSRCRMRPHQECSDFASPSANLRRITCTVVADVLRVHARVRGRRVLRPELSQVMVRVLIRRHAPLPERKPAKQGVNRPVTFARSFSDALHQ